MEMNDPQNENHPNLRPRYHLTFSLLALTPQILLFARENVKLSQKSDLLANRDEHCAKQHFARQKI